MTADGDHVIANPYQNEDLFWALRGGGGGTWGVVTSVTYRTHPSTPFSAAFIAVNSTNPTSTQNLFTEIIRLTPSLVEQGYGGYGGGSADGIQFFVLSPNVTAEETQATFFPLFDFAFSQEGLQIQNYTVVFEDFWKFYDAIWNTDGQVGVPSEISSWLLPKEVVATDKPEVLASELFKISGFGYLSVFFLISREAEHAILRIPLPHSLVTGGEVARVDPDSTGLNPAWRKSLVYTTLGTGWEDGADSTQIDAARQLLIQDMKILEGIAPESGAYLNEVRTTRFDFVLFSFFLSLP